MYILYFLAFIFGTSLGSFANVLADRIGVKNFTKDRSECLSCGKKLTWRELIPIFSYLKQKGRCANCKSEIPVSLLLSEIFSGLAVLFIIPVTTSFSINPIFQFLYFIILSLIICISVAIIIYDIRHLVVPIPFLITLFVLCALSMGLRFFVNGFDIYNLLAPIAISIPFTLLFIFSAGRWVGLGDILLYFCFGMMLSLPAAISSFFYSVWLGAFVSIFLMIAQKRHYNLKTEMPFTPFIIIGALLALYFNPDILYIKDLMSIYETF